MNALDKAINWLSPQAGLRRMRARIVLSTVEKLAYDAAQTGRRTDGWLRPGTSANAEIASGLKEARDGARDVVRNSPHGASAMFQFATKIVGTGIRPQARTGVQSTNDVLDKTFETWSKQVRYYETQNLAVRTIVESGEAVLRFRPRRKEDGLIVPLFPQLLEPDYIDHTRTMSLDNGGYIIQGVEFDGLDREIAVWMFGSHPGDVIRTSFKQQSTASYRVPVSTNNPLDGVVRGYRRDRAPQVRGMTWFAPILAAMWDLNGYEEAKRVRNRLEACLAMLVETPGDIGPGPAVGPQTKGPDGDTLEVFKPGMVFRGRTGEKVTFAEPTASGGYDTFTRRQDRLMAVGMGLLYELLTGDLSQVNYSSYRGGLVGFRDFIEFIQWLIMVPFICEPTWTRFVDGCKIAGIVPASTSYEVEWAPPAFDLLDRLNEAEADETEIRNGMSTWDQRVSARGWDPTKQADAIEKRFKYFKDHGIMLDCDPSVTDRKGAAQKNAPQEPPPAADQQNAA